VKRLVPALCLGTLVLTGEGTAARQVALTVTPRDALVDAPVAVRVTALRPRQAIVLQAVTRDARGKTWKSRLAYRADATGTVDTHSNMRLFWSMQPVGANGDLGLLPAPVSPVAISVVAGGRQLAATTLKRRLHASDVQPTELTVASDGLAGTFNQRPSTSPSPAVILLGGSAGGHGGSTGALLASHGYPALSLGYFGEPGLPAHLQDIPLEYFQRALEWLASRSSVDARHIAIIGISRGGEAAILVAAQYPGLVHGVLACTTSSHVLDGVPTTGDGAAWTIGGKPIIGGLLPIDRVTARTLITGGGQDEIADSGPATTELVEYARAHGRANVSGRIYARAGHGAGCRIPNVPSPSEVQVSPGTVAALGGTTAANSQAAEVSWPALLRLVAAG
jgi:dienelactone hydrolase